MLPSQERPSSNRAIAIVGMSCRFPGAENPREFWKLLEEGIDAVREVPKERWDLNAFYDPRPQEPGKTNSRFGGFLDQIDQFDSSFFRISAREAARMDPQQRLLLELAWEAFEDAGIPAEALSKKPVGVFLGIGSNHYFRLNANFSQVDGYLGMGSDRSICANRISYFFDLKGPSLAIDTACSSSLVAVHLACQSLQNEESSIALVGGSNLILSPEGTIALSQGGALSPEGRCKTFDVAANGYVRSEGTALLVLKPLAQALKDRDSIYGVIRGSAVNQDGKTNGLTAPNRQAQEEVILHACARAGIRPADLQYIETHGTGTPLGDAIEVAALQSALSPDRSTPCWLGSVKTNIGHCETASGMAGIFKVLLSFKQGKIPAHLHLKEASPHLALNPRLFKIPTRLTPWPTSHPYLAGVSAFGLGGTNAHLILEEAPKISPIRYTNSSFYFLPLSARSEAALRDLAESFISFLKAQPPSLQDVCYSASTRRTHHDFRLALIGCSRKEILSGLTDFFQGRELISGGRGVRAPSGSWESSIFFRGKKIEPKLLSKKKREHLVCTLAASFLSGKPVSWEELYPRGGSGVPLPHYPWQKQRYWMEKEVSAEPTSRQIPAFVVARERTDASLKKQLLCLEPSQQKARIQEFLKDQIAHTLGLSPERISLETAFASFGLDSIMALEIKNSVEARLGVALPLSLFWEEGSLASLAEAIFSSLNAASRSSNLIAVSSSSKGHLPKPHDLFSTATVAGFGLAARMLYGLEASFAGHLPEGPMILCPNHESHLDSLFVASLLPDKVRSNLVILSKKEHFDSFVTRMMVGWLRAIPVDRTGDVSGSLEILKNALLQGRSILLHPEGTRTGNGEIGKFKAGAALLALQTGVPLIPIRIQGAFAIYPKSRLLPQLFDWKRFQRLPLKIHFGEPIYPFQKTELPQIDRKEGMAFCAKQLTQKLQEAVCALS